MGKKSRRRAAAGGAVGRGGSGGGNRRSGSSSGIGNDSPPNPTDVPTMSLVSIADFPVEHKLEVPSLANCVAGVSERGFVKLDFPTISLAGIVCSNEDPTRCAHCSVKFEVGWEAQSKIFSLHSLCGAKVCKSCYDQHVASCGAISVVQNEQGAVDLFGLRVKAGVPWAQVLYVNLTGGEYVSDVTRRPFLLKILKNAADAGHPRACLMVSDLFRMGGRFGYCCKRDLPLAREYAERAMVLDSSTYSEEGTKELGRIALESIKEGNEAEALSILALYDGALYNIIQADSLASQAGRISINPIREANLRRRALHARAAIQRSLVTVYESDELRSLASKAVKASQTRLSELQGPSRVGILTDSSLPMDSSYLTSVGGNFCDCCGKAPSKAGVTVLLKCSRCRLAFYCSQDCQATAWENGHKACCFQHGRIKPDALYVTQGLTDTSLNGRDVKVLGKTSDSWQVRIDGQLHVVGSKNLRRARPCS